MKNRLQFNRHYAEFQSREDALTALRARITDPDFIPLIGEPIVFRYKDENDNLQVILAIGKKAGHNLDERDYHVIDTADLDEKIAAEVAAREKLDAETIKKVIFDGVESEFNNNVATLSVSANSIPIGAYEEYDGRANTPHPIHDDYSVLEAVKQVDTNFISFLNDTEAKVNGIHIVKVTSGLDANVREAYDLVNLSGYPQPNSERILIYKDSSLYHVYLGHTDDRLDDYTSPVVTPGTGDTALCFIYLKADSTYQLVAVNVEDFLQESEFEDGLVVNNHVVKVKIDRASESFLTVSPDGVKLAGVQGAIDAAQAEEEARATAVENAIQAELDATQTGAGLDADGSYIHDHPTSYIGNAESLANADHLLDIALKTESDRAIAAENSISAATKNEINRATAAESSLQNAINAEQTRAQNAESALDTRVTNLSAGTVSEVARLDGKIDTESQRATAAENIIDGKVDALSAATVAFSGATVSEIARIDATATRNKVKSTGHTIVVDEAAEGTNLEANIDRKTILSNSGVLKTGLKVAALGPGELEANVREAFRLVDSEGTPVDNTIVKIYKSSSLVSVELIKIGNVDYVRITYIDNEGQTRYMDLDIQQLIFEAEFKDGLVVNSDGEVRVKVDPTSENFLSVSVDGVKLTGVQNAIDSEAARALAAEGVLQDNIDAEETRAIAAENTLQANIDAEISARANADEAIQNELNKTQVGAGLAADGSYIHDHPTNYIGEAISLANADHLLDTAIKAEENRAKSVENVLQNNITTEENRARNAENALQNNIDSLSANTIAADQVLQNNINGVSADVNAEQTRAQNAEAVLDAKISGLSAGTVSEATRLNDKIDTESQRATAAENAIDNKVDSLSSVTAAFSSATVSEIARIDSSIAGNKVKSTGHTVVVTELADGTNLEANVDGKTILANNGALKTGLKFVSLPAGELEANVREAFKLADAEGTPVDNTTIKIYKSSSLEKIELVNVGGVDYIRVTYVDNSGLTQTMDLNIQQLVFEAEFKDGLSVNGNHEVKVEIDPTSEAYLTVSSNGVKLSGVQNAVDAAVATETARATAAENSISGNVAALSGATVGGLQYISGVTDNVINACGLNMGQQGGYIPHSNTHYISNARSLDQADVLLDQAIWAASSSATGEVAELENKLNDLSGVTRSFSSHTVSEIEALKVSVSANTGVTQLSAVTVNIVNNVTSLSSSTVHLSGDVTNLSGVVMSISGKTSGVLTLTMNGVEQGKYSPSANTTINLEAIQEITGADVLLTGYEIATGTTLEELIVKDTDTVNEAFGKIQKQIFDYELVTSAAFNDINDKIIELSGNTLDPSNYYTKTEIDNMLPAKKQFSTASSVTNLTFEKFLTVVTISNVTSTTLSITNNTAAWGLADGEVMEAHVIVKNNNSTNSLTVALPTSDSRVKITGESELLIDPNSFGEVNAIITRDGNNYVIYLITSF